MPEFEERITPNPKRCSPRAIPGTNHGAIQTTILISQRHTGNPNTNATSVRNKDTKNPNIILKKRQEETMANCTEVSFFRPIETGVRVDVSTVGALPTYAKIRVLSLTCKIQIVR